MSAIFYKMALDYDAIIVGGGPAGSATGINLLARYPSLKVLIADKADFPRDKACGDGLSPGAVEYLSAIGIDSESIPKSNMIKEAEIHGPGDVSFTSKLPNITSISFGYGMVVRRADFDNFLLEFASSKNACAKTGLRFEKYYQQEDKIVAAFVDAETKRKVEYSAQVLVGADGAVSRVRKTFGVTSNKPKHTGIAVRAYADLEYQHHDRIIMSYSDDLKPGYGWVFPLGDGTANVGLGLVLSEWRKTKPSLQKMLDSHIEYLHSKGIKISNIREDRVYTLPGGHIPKIAQKRVALIGDAASMINPLSGEGIMYGLKAADILAESIAFPLSQMNLREADLVRYEKTFKKEIVPHFRSCYIARNALAVDSIGEAILGGAKRNEQIRAAGVDLMFGEGRLTFKILRKLVSEYLKNINFSHHTK